ncbi:MAG: hypothetical protein R3A79_03915 [Nannocystaceae bacterium]
MDYPRLVASLLVAVALVACGDDGEATTASTTQTTQSTDTATATATDSDASTSTSDGSSTSDGGSTGVANDCDMNAIGEWNACKKGALTDNSLCNWTEDGVSSGEVRCLLPAGGGGSLCSIEGCEDDCDCFAPPSTGTAIVQCAPVLSGGVKACVLNCAGDVTCPDGMECISGYCYQPSA